MALGIDANAQRGVMTSTSDVWRSAIFILIAATGARTVGFAINRIIDRKIDARNPRTAMRDLPAGRMTLKEGYAVMVAGVVLYFAAAFQLNSLCVILSPIPLAVFAIYPFLKRFTPLAHFGVGLSLALGPLGAYFAVRPTLDGALPAMLLSIYTWLWVSGFDIIYATADEQFDKKEGLFSLPSRLGSKRALKVSAIIHVLAFVLLGLVYYTAFSRNLWALGLLVISGALLYLEQKKAEDVEMAFFKINAVLGFVVLLFVLAGVNLT
jgi:4-hydroxybenzoate polyprenyltransferase